jgi:short-subunit dehydrogenase
LTRPVALVTGASSGIGLELATILARDGYDLILVARRAERLEQIGKGLREEYGAAATSIVRDLSEPESPRAIAEEAAARGMAIEVLVNDAGLGVHGFFAETSLDQERAMIQVNIVALTELTKRLLPGMLERRRGRILNVASTAAFQPGPLMAVYYATKAYVLSFSEALANETAGTGVTVTALCPGPTITEFQKRAGMEETRLFRSPLVRDARSVALDGYAGMRRGKRVVVPGAGNWLFAQLVRLAPRPFVLGAVRRVQETRRP